MVKQGRLENARDYRAFVASLTEYFAPVHKINLVMYVVRVHGQSSCYVSRGIPKAFSVGGQCVLPGPDATSLPFHLGFDRRVTDGKR